jgi:hypothetical protein
MAPTSNAVAREMRAGYDGRIQAPIQQAALRNVGRIRYLPFVMAAVVRGCSPSPRSCTRSCCGWGGTDGRSAC